MSEKRKSKVIEHAIVLTVFGDKKTNKAMKTKSFTIETPKSCAYTNIRFRGTVDDIGRERFLYFQWTKTENGAALDSSGRRVTENGRNRCTCVHAVFFTWIDDRHTVDDDDDGEDKNGHRDRRRA